MSSSAAMPALAGVVHRMVPVAPGVRLHVADSGAGSPVLLVHGPPQNWWEWRHIIPALAADRRALAADLRGVGWSDAPDRGYDIARQTEDLLSVLDALDVERTHVVDSSGFLGWQLAFDHPDRVASLTAIASPHPWSGITPKMLVQLWRVWFQQAVVSPIGPRLIAGGRQRLVRYMLGEHVRGVADVEGDDLEAFLAPLRHPARARALTLHYRHLVLPSMLAMGRRWKRRRLTVPTRVLLGERDPIMRFARSDDVGGRADDLRVVRVAGAGHFVATTHPEGVVATVRELAG